MADIIVRRADFGDAAAVASLEKRCFAIPWTYEQVAADLSNNKLARYFVAEEDGIVCGYVGVYIVAGEAQITNVAVAAAYRLRGVGSMLIEALIAEADKCNAPDITLEVRPSNTPALALYTKYGFKEEGRRKEYYPDNREDAIIMWRRGEELV